MSGDKKQQMKIRSIIKGKQTTHFSHAKFSVWRRVTNAHTAISTDTEYLVAVQEFDVWIWPLIPKILPTKPFGWVPRRGSEACRGTARGVCRSRGHTQELFKGIQEGGAGAYLTA